MTRLQLLCASILFFACSPGAPGTPPGRCLTDTDCDGSGRCIDGLCTGTEPDCTADSDCADGLLCTAGRCTMRSSSCVDGDGDGFGEGCVRGPDCDDGNATQTGTEICDGMDNDCDGVADNGVVSECGDCNPDCEAEGLGEGTPFDPEMADSDGVGLDEDGALVLDSRRINTNFIWVANSSEGSVSRLSTTAPYNEVGRYFTGPAGAGNDPSRTSVNSVGDAFVGNRRGTSISRISVLGEDCPDTNGDGAITTSQDLNGDGVISRDAAAGEMLPWGEDDCVLWHRDLADVFPGENLIRAVAAQDIEGPDGTLEEYVWIGGFTTRQVAKLDGATGEPVLVTESPANTYGFALDGDGQLWVAGRGNRGIGRLDTNRCVDAASCAGAICVAASGEGVECDDAVKARIPAPHRPYGITVDFNQRVWIGGDEAHPSLTYDARFARYDPAAAAGSRWIAVNVTPNGHVVNGIAADAVGNVWGAAWSTAGIIRIDADNPTNWTTVAGTTGVNNKGMAVDAAGRVWSITNGNNQAVLVTPGAALADNTVESGVGAATLVGNYTYSDMTGLQLRLATNPRGYYRHVFEGCDSDSSVGTIWDEVRFDAETPAGTSVSIRVRTADTREALEDAEWVQVGMAPPETSPFSVSAALMDAGVMPMQFLMLELSLRAERSSTIEIITPRVRSVELTRTCQPIFG